MPWINHSWHVTLYVSPKGFTTGSVPFKNGVFEIEFNLHDHRLEFRTSEGKSESIPLTSGTISSFYTQVLEKLSSLGIDIDFYEAPNEMDPSIPFEKDNQERTYDPDQMHKLWKAFVQVHKVFIEFRSRFSGKSSPVHLFWGAFDLAVTRFSGRPAPKHPGGMPNMPLDVMQEAYSHEVSSCGFWPGSAESPHPVFYAYCYPTPAEYGNEPIEPSEAFYSQDMGEFFLPYAAIASADHPEEKLLKFLETTYTAAAKTGQWPTEEFAFAFH